MIIKLHFAPFNYLIRTLLANESFLSLEPIIAGGFPVALFCALKNIDSKDDWMDLVNEVNSKRYKAIATEFGDIDCYFMHDNPIWTAQHRWLVADAPHAETEIEQDNIFGLSRPRPDYYYKWANNYVQHHEGTEIRCQFVKQPQTNVADCLTGFDLLISCIAWYRDHIYVHESFEDAFDRAEIQANTSGFYKRSRDDVYARMFTAARAYKYASRMHFKLSKELNAYCSGLYAETKSIDLSSATPLRNAAGRTTRNPVPSSQAFRGVAKRFWQWHEAYQDGAAQPLPRRTEQK